MKTLQKFEKQLKLVKKRKEEKVKLDTILFSIARMKSLKISNEMRDRKQRLKRNDNTLLIFKENIIVYKKLSIRELWRKLQIIGSEELKCISKKDGPFLKLLQLLGKTHVFNYYCNKNILQV